MNKKDLDEISEFECPDCHGTGENITNIAIQSTIISTCRTCEGTGKLDWIEAIVGKKSKYETILDEIKKHMVDKVDKELENLYKQGF